MKLKDLVKFFQSNDYVQLRAANSSFVSGEEMTQSKAIQRLEASAQQAPIRFQNLLGIVAHLSVLGKPKEANELLEDAIENGNQDEAYQAETQRILGMRKRNSL